jgi:hypothetical protein
VISGERERLNMTQTVSERGVVFFRNQNDLAFEDQKTLGQKLGELTGKPETSKVEFSSLKTWIKCLLFYLKLHRHALLNGQRGIAVDENGNKLDDEISIISSEVRSYLDIHGMASSNFAAYYPDNAQQFRKFYKERFSPHAKRIASEGWHAE